MITACWSVKGGVGTTVIAAGLALVREAGPDDPVLLVDLAGDLPTVLGLTEPVGPGVAEWLAAGVNVPPDALARLETPVAPGLALLHRGIGPLDPRRADVLIQLLGALHRPVVADCGLIARGGVAARVAAEAGRSLLVSRLCVLSMRRAAVAPLRPSGVVIIRDVGRSISGADIGRCAGAPVVAEVAADLMVARAVDAGLLASRLPRAFAETLRKVA